MKINQRDNNFIPQSLESKPLVYTQHALKALHNDRYGIVPQVAKLPSSAYCFQYETKYSLDTKSNKICKYGMRFNYNTEYDIILILVDNGDSYKVITSWINCTWDNHSEQDTANYHNARSKNNLGSFKASKKVKV